MKHCMLDLESMGDDCVVSIGAVQFDPHNYGLGDTFHENIKAESLEKYGIYPNGSTIRWWLKQDKNAQNALAFPAPQPVDEVLSQLSRWWQGTGLKYLWSHSYYDAATMIRLYRKIKGWFPWRGKDIRDYRMIVAQAPGPLRKQFKPMGVHHNALSDAANQARFTQFVTQSMNLRFY